MSTLSKKSVLCIVVLVLMAESESETVLVLRKMEFKTAYVTVGGEVWNIPLTTVFRRVKKLCMALFLARCYNTDLVI